MKNINFAKDSCFIASTTETERSSETQLPNILPLDDLFQDDISGVEKNKKGCGFGWTPLENKRYQEFLSQNQSLFCLSLEEKKRLAIHSQMSQTIKSRTSLQCRSHHQKMIKKYGSVDKIIALLSTTLQEKDEKMNEKMMMDLTYF